MGSCNDILSLRVHPLQHLLPPTKLVEGVKREFVRTTNEIGFHINKAVQHPQQTNLEQFVSGFDSETAKDLIVRLKAS